MKTILAATLLLSSVAFSAKPSFGAFTYRNYLYVTYLADCNTLDAKLEVDALCHKDRLTRNYALECETELQVASTRMICPEMIYPPKVFVFDLANEPIATEARELVIKHKDQMIRVEVNRE